MTIKIDLSKMITAETLTAEQIAADLKALKLVVDNHLAAFAKDSGYDSITSMVSYSLSSILTFKTDGQRAISYRDACWQKFIDLTEDTSNLPSSNDLLDALPAPV